MCGEMTGTEKGDWAYRTSGCGTVDMRGKLMEGEVSSARFVQTHFGSILSWEIMFSCSRNGEENTSTEGN